MEKARARTRTFKTSPSRAKLTQASRSGSGTDAQGTLVSNAFESEQSAVKSFSQRYSLVRPLASGVYSSLYVAQPLANDAAHKTVARVVAGLDHQPPRAEKCESGADSTTAHTTEATCAASNPPNLVAVKQWNAECISRAALREAGLISGGSAHAASTRSPPLAKSNGVATEQALVGELECMVRELEVARRMLRHPNVVQYIDTYVAISGASARRESINSDEMKVVDSPSLRMPARTGTTSLTMDFNASATSNVEDGCSVAMHIVMEYLSGVDLRAAQIHIGKGRAFREDVVRSIMEQVFSGLSFLHAHNIIHRDMKPENIVFAAALPTKSQLVAPDLSQVPSSSVLPSSAVLSATAGGSTLDAGSSSPSDGCEAASAFAPLAVVPPLRLVDFNMSCVFGTRVRRKKQVTSGAFGTPSYTAPEIVMSRTYDYRVDCWSCGVIMYELLCGVLPFEADSVTGVLKALLTKPIEFEEPAWHFVSPAAKELVIGLLERDQAKRFTSRSALRHRFFGRSVLTRLRTRISRPPSDLTLGLIPPDAPISSCGGGVDRSSAASTSAVKRPPHSIHRVSSEPSGELALSEGDSDDSFNESRGGIASAGAAGGRGVASLRKWLRGISNLAIEAPALLGDKDAEPTSNIARRLDPDARENSNLEFGSDSDVEIVHEEELELDAETFRPQSWQSPTHQNATSSMFTSRAYRQSPYRYAAHQAFRPQAQHQNFMNAERNGKERSSIPPRGGSRERQETSRPQQLQAFGISPPRTTISPEQKPLNPCARTADDLSTAAPVKNRLSVRDVSKQQLLQQRARDNVLRRSDTRDNFLKTAVRKASSILAASATQSGGRQDGAYESVPDFNERVDSSAPGDELPRTSSTLWGFARLVSRSPAILAAVETKRGDQLFRMNEPE